MNPSKTKQIILVSLLGVVAALFIVEVALRIIGAIYIAKTSSRETIVIREDADHFNVLCTGASWCAGHGAPPGEDYPSHLERILNEKVEGRTFTVYRRAVVNHNTAQILARLESDIDETHPDLVVIMGGVANVWNHWGFFEHTQASAAVKAVSNSLEEVKTYKLAKLLATDIRGKRSRTYALKRAEEEEELEGPKMMLKEHPDDGRLYARIGFIYLKNKNAFKAEQYFSEGIKKAPEFLGNYTGLGAVNALQGDFDDSVKWYKKAIKMSPETGQNYAGLAWVYSRQREYEKARQNYEKALNISRRSVQGAVWKGGYIAVAQMYDALGEEEKAEEFFSSFREAQTSDETYSEKDRHQRILEWIKEDYSEMIDICAGRGIPVIMQTFPNNTYDQEGIGINNVLREIAKEKEVPLVDQYELFIEHIKTRGVKRGELFEFENEGSYYLTIPASPGINVRIARSAEGHCNGRGYHLMADNIYNKIIEEDLLKKP